MAVTTYDFVVRGRITIAELDRLAPLQAEPTADGGTRLRGSMRDQAELHGVLRRISALGLVLEEVGPAVVREAFPARYEVEVAARLSAPLRQAFPEAEIVPTAERTRLIAAVADRHALDRLLERLADLGLAVCSVRRRDRPGST